MIAQWNPRRRRNDWINNFHNNLMPLLTRSNQLLAFYSSVRSQLQIIITNYITLKLYDSQEPFTSLFKFNALSLNKQWEKILTSIPLKYVCSMSKTGNFEWKYLYLDK